MADCCAAVAGLTDGQREALAASLRAVGGHGEESLSSIARRLGIPKSTLSRHRSACLYLAPAERSTDALEHPIGTQRNAHLTRESPTPDSGVSNVHDPPPALALPDPAIEERIDTIADMVRFALWKNRGTVLGMARKWGISEHEVNKLHRTACRRLAASRGGFVARREGSVAVCLKIRDDQLAYADRLTAEVEEALRTRATGDKPAKEPDHRSARSMSVLADGARSVALAAQARVDSWDQKAPTVTVNVGLDEGPDAGQTWALVRRMLDAWAPGLAERIDEGLGVYQDRGEAGLAEHITEVTRDMGAVVVSA